jgi:hypothetical protein
MVALVTLIKDTAPHFTITAAQFGGSWGTRMVRIDSKNLEQFTVFLKDPWFRDRSVNLCSQSVFSASVVIQLQKNF